MRCKILVGSKIKRVQGKYPMEKNDDDLRKSPMCYFYRQSPKKSFLMYLYAVKGNDRDS